MQIAVVLYDRLTTLDAIGPYEVLRSLPGAEVTFVAERRGEVRNDAGSLGLVADAAFDEVDAADVLVVPGGPGSRARIKDEPLLAFLRRIDTTTTWTTSVCTGSLLLAAAGLLTGRRATTHWLATDLLAELGATPTPERVVFDGKYVTGAGVSAGIDLALTLAAHLTDDATAQLVQLAIEYDPQPPFNAGSPTKAPAEVVTAARTRQARILESQAR